jgi:hypothetical protein
MVSRDIQPEDNSIPSAIAGIPASRCCAVKVASIVGD